MEGSTSGRFETPCASPRRRLRIASADQPLSDIGLNAGARLISPIADGRLVQWWLSEPVERRRGDPTFQARVRQIIEADRELLERLAK
jgi:hypothetical protein